MARLPDGRRLPGPVGDCPPSRARRAAARLPGQGLRELPAAAARPAAALNPRLDGAQPVRPRHRAASSCSPTRATSSPTSRTRSPTRRTSTRRGTRISARRHARLVDYRMHDGRNAWAVVHAARRRSARRATTSCRPGRRPLFTRIVAPLPRQTSVRRAPSSTGSDHGRARSPATPTLAGVGGLRDRARTVRCRADNNEIRLHTWGERGVLPRRRARPRRTSTPSPDGTTAAPAGAAGRRLPRCSRRSRGPAPGVPADADPGAPPGRPSSSRSRRADDRSRSTATRSLADELQIRRTGDDRAAAAARHAGAARTRSRFPLCLSRDDPDRRPRSSATSRSRAATSSSPTTA